MWDVMTACVIMYNMIVEEERNDSKYDQGWEFEGELVITGRLRKFSPSAP
jgi:hypothetical protein